MKHPFILLAMSAAAILSAAAAPVPETKEINVMKDLLKRQYSPAPLGADWIMVPGIPKAGWMKSIPDGGIKFQMNGRTDLDKVKQGKFMDECTIYHEFDAARAGEYLLGFAADWWWELYLNGELCCSRMKHGNLKVNFTADECPTRVMLRQGKNLLAARIRRGSSPTWFASCQGVNTPPVSAAACFGPWLCSPDSGCVGVRFLTEYDVAAGVEFRKKGDSAWQIRWHARHGQCIRTDHHLVELTGLEPGTEYEYRLVMRLPAEPLEIVADKQIFSFTAPDPNRKHVSFLFTADLQYNQATQKKYTKAMFKAADYRSADFFVLGGDMAEYQDLRKELLGGMIQNLIDHGAAEKPVIVVRGNHELRGKEAWLFDDFFALPDGRTYGIFRFGETAFLVLDCWEDKPASSNTVYTQFNFDADYLRAEKEYLEEALKAPVWTTAKRRIVLAHGATYSNYDGCRWQPFQLQKMTDSWFHGKTPKYPLDLWLCGHSHIHLRSVPGTDILVSPVQPPRPHRTGENDIYPVLTVGGPNRSNQIQASLYRVDIFSDRIAVKAFDQNGTLIDDVVYPDGKAAQENLALPHFQMPAGTDPELYR